MNKDFLFYFLVLASTLTFAQNKDSANVVYKTFTFSDGTKSSEGYLQNGKPDGYWKNYYPSGNLQSEGNRVDFELDGQWIFYTDSLTISAKVNYSKGKKSGFSYNYGVDGFLVSKEFFVNDKRDSLSYFFYPYGRIREKVNFKKGLRDAWSFEYDDEDGRIIKMTEYKAGYVRQKDLINRFDKQGRKHGLWREFFSDSEQISMEGEYVEGLKHGYWKEYSKKGLTLNTYKYQMGDLVEDAEELMNLEVFTYYHSNGTIRAVKTFRDGLEEGIFREYNEEGIITATILPSNIFILFG